MNNKLKKVCFLILGVGLFTLNILLAFCNAHSFLKLNLTMQILYLLFCLVVHFVLFLFIKNWIQREKSFVFLFGSLLFIMGFLYLFLIPFSRVPDEETHFLRSYEISEGNLVSKKNEDGTSARSFPKEIFEVSNYEDIFTYHDVLENIQVQNSNEKVNWGYDGASLYSFLSYIPQSLGIFIARFFTSSAVIEGYFGRIFNFLFCACLLILAYKLLPCFKKSFMIICFLPIVLQEIVSLSPDGMTISFSLLLLSYILHLRYTKKEKMTKGDFAFLTCIITFLSLSKIVYLPLCFLIFLIPKERFQSNKQRYITMGMLSLWACFLNLAWLSIAWGYLVEYREGINAMQQVLFIFKSPIHYFMTFLNTFSLNFGNDVLDLVGQSLEWYNIQLSSFYVLMTLGVFSYFAYQDHTDKVKMNSFMKWILLGVLVISVGLIYTSLYVQWTPVGKNIILGVQGRYFLPLLFLLPCLCYNSNRKVKENKNTNLYFLTYLICYNLYALMIIFLNHIV